MVLSTILLKGWTPLLGLHNKKFTSFKKKDSLFFVPFPSKEWNNLMLSFH